MNTAEFADLRTRCTGLTALLRAAGVRAVYDALLLAEPAFRTCCSMASLSAAVRAVVERPIADLLTRSVIDNSLLSILISAFEAWLGAIVTACRNG